MTEKQHAQHPSLAMLEDLAKGKKLTSFWETMGKEQELVYFKKKGKGGKRKKKKKAKAKEAEKEEEPAPAPAAPAPAAEEPKAEEPEPVAAEEPAAAAEPEPEPEPEAAPEEPAPAAAEEAPKAAEKQEEAKDADAPAAAVAITVEDTTKPAEQADPKTGTRGSVDEGPETEKKDDEEEAQLNSTLNLPEGAKGGDPTFTEMFFPTSDTHIREFSFIDLDQMVAQLQDEVKQDEAGKIDESQKIENLTEEADTTETKQEDRENNDPNAEAPEKPEKETAEYVIEWEKRPLGIEVVRGVGGLNAWVRRVLNKDLEEKIQKGSYIVKVNDSKVLGESYSRILKVISRVQGTIKITFDVNPTLDPVIPVGSMVRLHDLSRETSLNGCVGFIFAEMVDGRYPVKLHQSGDQVGVKPKNVMLLERPPDQKQADDKEKNMAFNLTGNYELIKTKGMNKFLQSQGMSWFKTKMRFNPKLTISIKQQGNQFEMTFTGPKGAITDTFTANKSTFTGRTFSAMHEAFKSAVIVDNELQITEVNRNKDKKTIVFKPTSDGMSLSVTNAKGATMTQLFRKITV